MEGEGDGRSGGILAHHKDGMRRHRKDPSRGQGGGERRGGRPRPALECIFRLSFLLAVGETVFLSFLCLFLCLSTFSLGVLVGHYDRLGRLTRICVGYTQKQLPSLRYAAAEPLPWPFGPHVAG